MENSSENKGNYGATIYEGDLYGNKNFDRDHIIKGNLYGSVTIFPGIKVIIKGNLHGNVTIQNEGTLKVEGDLNGDLKIYSGVSYNIEGVHSGNVNSY